MRTAHAAREAELQAELQALRDGCAQAMETAEAWRQVGGVGPPEVRGAMEAAEACARWE